MSDTDAKLYAGMTREALLSVCLDAKAIDALCDEIDEVGQELIRFEQEIKRVEVERDEARAAFDEERREYKALANLLGRTLAQRDELAEALREYLREQDQPIRDLTLVQVRREQMRAALAKGVR